MKNSETGDKSSMRICEKTIAERVKIITHSTAWNNTQRNIKRNKKEFESNLSKVVASSEDNFIFAEVKALYMAYLAAALLNHDAIFKNRVVITRLHRTDYCPGELSYGYVIAPKPIVRKVDGFMTQSSLCEKINNERSNIEGGSQKSINQKGSLYRIMRDACNDIRQLDEKIAYFPIDRSEMLVPSGLELRAHSVIKPDATPTLMLLLLELNRLGYREYSKTIIKLILLSRHDQSIDAVLLEKLGNALFFTFLSNDDSQQFSAFMPGLLKELRKYQKKQEIKFIQFLSDFISEVDDLYLSTAYKRRKIKGAI